jgi:hypothetical protein
LVSRARSTFTCQHAGEVNRRPALFDGQPRRAKALSASAGKRFEATLKHLEAVLKSGLIVAEQDPADTRRRLYTLAPSVKTETTPEGRTLDFGYCVVRVLDVNSDAHRTQERQARRQRRSVVGIGSAAGRHFMCSWV